MSKDKNFDNFKNMLREDYLVKYKTIEQYILCSESIFDKKNECLEESLDLLLCAQHDGKLPEDVIGKDIREFCLNILKSVHTESLPYIIAFRILLGSIIAVILGLIFYLGNRFLGGISYVQEGKVSIIMTYGWSFLMPLIDYTIDSINRKIILKKGESKHIKKRSLVSIICSFICFLILEFIHSNLSGKISSDILYIDIRTLVVLPIIIFIAMVIFSILENNGGISALLSGEIMAKSKKHWRIMLSEALYEKYSRKKAQKERYSKEYALEDFKRDQRFEINFSHIVLCIFMPLVLLFDGYLICITLKRGLNFFVLFTIGILSLFIMIIIKYITLKKKQLDMLEELK